MGKHIYENGHINAIQPYYFMLNGQRYNAAHFNSNIVFKMIIPAPTITTAAVNVTSTSVTITSADANDEIWWAVNTPTNFQRWTGGTVTLTNKPNVIYAYVEVDGMQSKMASTPLVSTPTLTVDYASAYGQVVWFNDSTSGATIYWTNDNWSTYNSANDGDYTELERTMTVKCAAMKDGMWSNTVSQLCVWNVPEPIISFDDDTITIDSHYTGTGNTVITYYRIGTTGSYAVYTDAIEIEDKVTVYAYNVEGSYLSNTSNVVSLYCNPYATPFYVEAGDSAQTLSIKKNASNAPTLTIQYSTNKRTWYNLGNTSTTAITRSVSKGQRLYLRCRTNSWSKIEYVGGVPGTIYYNIISGVRKVGGNIMSLLYGTYFDGEETSFSADYTFWHLFDSNSSVLFADKLLLPATTLREGCYGYMFSSCVNLRNSPKLKAMTMVEKCYYGMFYNCQSLTAVPELPATTVAVSCYEMMFYSCLDITSGGVTLPATTLAASCYNQMFRNCKRLIITPILAGTTLAINCYKGMFRNCTALNGGVPALSATTLDYNCYEEMFYGCTSLTTAPDLPATILVDGCYLRMFRGCTLLNSVKCLATTNVGAAGITDDWLYQASATGHFYKASGVTWPTGTSGIPTGWTYQDV